MFKPENVLEGARSIRPYLAELLGMNAEQVDQQLADLLARAETGQEVDKQILELLKSDEETYYWIAEFLSEPPESKGFQQLPGQGRTQQTQKYICPIGNDYTYYRRSGESIKICPTHNVALIPADQSTNN